MTFSLHIHNEQIALKSATDIELDLQTSNFSAPVEGTHFAPKQVLPSRQILQVADGIQIVSRCVV